ncbi:MAG: ATP-binding cassette domain-containing protein [Bacteroidaceae bacterium]|nr:ATP-binding cassette domain-containing protein [Bacteroidaceae bacterium]
MISILDAQPLHPAFRLPCPLSLHVERGHQLALTGGNGSGKTTLGRVIAGALPLREGHIEYGCARSAVKYVAFRDAWGDTLPTAHQLRWHHGENIQSPTVSDFLGQTLHTEIYRTAFPQMDGLKDKCLHHLSSGELRKLHLVKAMAQGAAIVVVDEPYIGLDAQARQEFTAFLTKQAEKTTFVLLLADERDVPPFITDVARVERMTIVSVQQRTDLAPPPSVSVAQRCSTARPTTEEVVRLNDVSVNYFGKEILHHVSWVVHRGERWALTGANGSGKSTLLSLICADNPMAYALDVRVFGCRRGRGGSIWDVKRRIGYVSPEQVRSITASQRVYEVVASGLNATGTLFRATTTHEQQQAAKWLSALGIAQLGARDFLMLSEGEKRMVLLARAFVNHPDLLILDEPFHGLDPQARSRAHRVIDEYVGEERTLIMVSHYPMEYAALTQQELHLTKPKPNS